MRRKNQTNWPLKKLKTIAEIVSGSTPKTSNKDYWNGNILWVTPKDLSKLRGKYIEETEKKITEAGYQSCSTTLVPAGSVLLSSRAPIGHLAIAKKELCTNQGFKTFLPKPELDSGYLYYALKYYMQEIKNIGRGAIFAEISKSMIENFEIPVPESYEDQIRIATLLSHVEAQIAARKESLKLLDELVKSAFLKMFGDPVKNENGWTQTNLGSLLTFITSGGRGWSDYYSDQGARFIRSFDVQMNYIGNEDIVFVKPPQNAEAERTRIQKNDVLLTITGSKIGRVATAPQSVAGSYISQHVAILRLDETLVNPTYLAFFLSSENGGQQQINKAQYGQSKPGLNFERIKKFTIPLPPLALQDKFAELLEKTEGLKPQYQQSLSEFENLYASLSQRAFKGELDLSQIEFEKVEVKQETRFNLTETTPSLLVGIDLSESVRYYHEVSAFTPDLKPPTSPEDWEIYHRLPEKYDKIIFSSINTHFADRSFDFDKLINKIKPIFDFLDLEEEEIYQIVRNYVLKWLEDQPPLLSQTFSETERQIELQRQ